MCVATVYIESDGGLRELMSEVIRIEVEDGGLRVTNLLGEEKYVRGGLRSIDFWEEHSVVLYPADKGARGVSDT